MAWGLATLAGALLAAGAAAQTFDVGRPRTLIVGTPSGARADRVDAERTGLSRDPLPAGSLRIAWQTPPLGLLLDDAPVVDASGTAYLVGTRGEVVAIARDGSERWRASTGAVQPGPAALLSDDTLVFADAVGEAVAVKDGAVRWRVRFGRGDASHPAPLPLADGGVIVATAHDLAALDVDGHERDRTTLPEAATGALVASRGSVLATGASGVVWSWTPGAPEAERAGSFGAPTEGGAVLVDDHTLVAVTAGGTKVSALDLGPTGVGQLRQITQIGQLGQGLSIGGTAGIWLGPPAAHAGNVYLVLLTPAAELAVALDRTGAETMRARIATHTPMIAADGGMVALAPVQHAPPLVDASGTLAFASTDGALGTVGAGTVEELQAACVSAARVPSADAARVAGLAPLAPGMFLAACHSGTLVALRGAAGASPAGESPSGHL
jgi:outer membrane protein assembly factor BamB